MRSIELWCAIAHLRISRFRVWSFGPSRNDTLRKLAFRNDLRPRRLMHRRVFCVRDPWLLVDHRQPPDALVRACKVIEPRHRTIADFEGEPLFGLTERQPDGGHDRSAMGDRDDIPSRLFSVDPLDGATGAIV